MTKMTERRFVNHSSNMPPKSGFALPIKSEEWEQYYEPIRVAHHRSMKRAEILKLLDSKHDFRPTANQLASQMKRWNFKVYNKSTSQDQIQHDKTHRSGEFRISNQDAIVEPASPDAPPMPDLKSYRPRDEPDPRQILQTLKKAEIWFVAGLHSRSWEDFNRAFQMTESAIPPPSSLAKIHGYHVESVIGCLKTASNQSQRVQTRRMLGSAFLRRAFQYPDTSSACLASLFVREWYPDRLFVRVLPTPHGSKPLLTVDPFLFDILLGFPPSGLVPGFTDSDDFVEVEHEHKGRNQRPRSKLPLNAPDALASHLAYEGRLRLISKRDPAKLFQKCRRFLLRDPDSIKDLQFLFRGKNGISTCKQMLFDLIFWRCLKALHAEPNFWSASFRCVDTNAYFDLGGPMMVCVVTHMMVDCLGGCTQFEQIGSFWRVLQRQGQSFETAFMREAAKQLVLDYRDRRYASADAVIAAEYHISKLDLASDSIPKFEKPREMLLDYDESPEDLDRTTIGGVRTRLGASPPEKDASKSGNAMPALEDPALSSALSMSSGSFRSFVACARRLSNQLNFGRSSSNRTTNSKNSRMSIDLDLDRQLPDILISRHESTLSHSTSFRSGKMEIDSPTLTAHIEVANVLSFKDGKPFQDSSAALSVPSNSKSEVELESTMMSSEKALQALEIV